MTARDMTCHLVECGRCADSQPLDSRRLAPGVWIVHVILNRGSFSSPLALLRDGEYAFGFGWRTASPGETWTAFAQTDGTATFSIRHSEGVNGAQILWYRVGG